MSGTTAITSFSMVEAEFLEPKYILKHMRKLCDATREFLDHLAPNNGTLRDDLHNIHEIQKPDSDFTEDYRDFNNELNVHLGHYKSEENSYIHVRAIHRVLFDGDRDVAAAQSGIDLVLYMANLLICAKQMIHSDRNEKEIWDALRQLDNSFPSQFMRSLEAETKTTTAAESALLQDTFSLALDLRTQLAILVLERSAVDSEFNPDEVIREVFFRSESSQESENSIIRGWNILALGGEDSALPQQFEPLVVERLNTMRQYFPLDAGAVERGDAPDIEGLGAHFPWEVTILRLLEWVRRRHRELSTAINELGGAAAIVRNVKAQMDEAQASIEQPRPKSIPPESPRKRRTSFGRHRRRSSRKFDPNAPIDLQAIDALKARERLSGVSTTQNMQAEVPAQPSVEEEEDPAELPIVQVQDQDYQPIIGEEDDESLIEQEDAVAQKSLRGQDTEEEPQPGAEPEIVPIVELEPETNSTEPPESSAALLKALKKVSQPEKENRSTSIFDRQTGAQRVEFGDGFDDPPTPGPSTREKGKQRAQPLPSRKRPRPAEVETEDEDDAFETEDRTALVKERRQKAPVAKKVRIDPTSSGAPPSHQPPPRREPDEDYSPRAEQNDSISENEAPDMTEEAPPSTYQDQRRLAKQNSALPSLARRTDRKPRTEWTEREENTFAEYMAMFPARYAAILRYDEDQGHRVLKERTQVNLKDKARSMAINMIKYVSVSRKGRAGSANNKPRSGTGLMTGFEDIVKPTSAHGKALTAQGYTW
jgi:hypothetical protein